jgi:hypothetical protein
MKIERDVDSLHALARRGLLVLLVAGFVVSCVSVKKPPGTVTAQFFRKPDRV